MSRYVVTASRSDGGMVRLPCTDRREADRLVERLRTVGLDPKIDTLYA